ncbi:MAG: hypothetical protein P0Y58_05080 [Candidatus Pseudomonas phytovorans]|uniref:Uncharacterized protein n=1 Tax=Candidatus Pseudomonas phytovorans TaxID=3121377 RepID=A0AAJ5WKZ9_9PSED|nr:hypothetical protein [Pseudomonas sp.]WEK31573.1 MAG: hypothetical protein P0Y58_05080 [Pseudomonas sp.]
MSAFSEISSFGEEWKGTTNFKVMPVGNYVFTAMITYISDRYGTERGNCTVQIIRNGMQDGEIIIYANGALQSESHHLSFIAKWQKYEFDKQDGTLVVTGNSDKMGGDYSVRMLPSGQVPSFL